MPKNKVVTPLSQLLDVLVHQYGGTCANFASAARITRAQLSHYMNPRPNAQKPGVLVCLKIAVAGHCSPVRVLRAANQHVAADLVEAFVGVPKDDIASHAFRTPQVTPLELTLMHKFRRLATKDQRALTVLIDTAHDANVLREERA